MRLVTNRTRTSALVVVHSKDVLRRKMETRCNPYFTKKPGWDGGVLPPLPGSRQSSAYSSAKASRISAVSPSFLMMA
ncbi:hypothetical protein DR66_6112 [Delftia acidovorans]|nr:hypothetical protein DR66_6112 [Delftia acidovorans]